MYLELPEDVQAIKINVAKLVNDKLAPMTRDIDQRDEYPWEARKILADQGVLSLPFPEEYGGVDGRWLSFCVAIEEVARVNGAVSMMVGGQALGSGAICFYGNEEQKRKYIPRLASGELIPAFGLTEPNAGSDASSIRANAVRQGDEYVINGAKTFISNGINSNLVIVACKTSIKADPPYRGISLLVVEEGTPGFSRGRKLNKMGLHSQDTAELFFEDCRVPRANLLGQEGLGFKYIMQKLQQERLVCAIWGQALAEKMLKQTIEYCQSRKVFGHPVSEFQHNSFKLAEMGTEIELGRTFLDNLVEEHLAGNHVVKKVSMAKYWITEMANRIAYNCLQLHGGYGYMEEYPICRDYRDVRIFTIFAGTSEVMKSIIAKEMGL